MLQESMQRISSLPLLAVALLLDLPTSALLIAQLLWSDIN